MNAILALCHFCEQHGPRVLFCTQPFHEQEPLQTLTCSVSSDLESCSSKISSQSTKMERSASVEPSLPVESNSSLLTASRERCEGCRSLGPNEPGYISKDLDAKVKYVSSQQPHQDELFSILRQACIRSLSSEVCPGREGPIFFGDSDTRYVLSYTFHLQDTRARGGRRLYSVIVVMMDKIYLLNSWPFLVKHLREIVGDLQRKAKGIYDVEESCSPTRSHRLSKERSYTIPTQCRLQRSHQAVVRSLADLTGDGSLFKTLHLAFTWLLKACSNRLREKLLEGPPTEDTIVDLEKKEEIVDDFVMVNTEKVAVSNHSSTSLSISSMSQIAEGMDHGPKIRNLRDLYERLGYNKFHQLAHHVIIGNQVIVQSESHSLTRSIIDCLQVLLPKGCCKTIYFSEAYEESWKCNFLGLSKFSVLPEHVIQADDYILINVESPSTAAGFMELSTDALVGYRFQLHPEKSKYERISAPKILDKMERALANLKLNWNVVEQCLVCIKEEWMNKVKVLYTFTKAGGSRTEEDTKKLLQVFGASDEDRRALKFWMTGLSHQYKNHMRHTSKQL